MINLLSYMIKDDDFFLSRVLLQVYLKNILKQGVGEGKSCSWGEGF